MINTNSVPAQHLLSISSANSTPARATATGLSSWLDTVGAAREHREVDHVRESSQHLFVNGAEIDCGEIVARERGKHRVSRGENVYKVEPQRTKIRLNTCCRHPFSHPPLSSSLLGGLPSLVDESGGNIGNGGD